MKSQILITYSNQNSRILRLGEILIVFLPTVLLFLTMSPWAGEDVIRNLGVVWASYILMLVMIWIGLKLRGRSWNDFGLTLKPVSLSGGLKIFGLSLLVFVAGVSAYIFGQVLMANVAGMPESADFTKYDFLKDNLGGLFLSLASVYLVSSFGEEVIFRGFLITRISELLNTKKYSKVIAVILSSIFFGVVHYEWGLMGMVQTGFMGLAMGICYIKLKKRLWILVLAHAYMDTILLVQLYIASN